MRLGGRMQAAIEIINDVFTRHRPAAEALKDWGKNHRFAGSTDRHVIATLVYDLLRQRNSLSAQMNSQDPDALVAATLRFVWQVPFEEIIEATQMKYGPAPLSKDISQCLQDAFVPRQEPWIMGDFPQWTLPLLEEGFHEAAAIQGAALARRAPIDLRVNLLKATRQEVQAALQAHNPILGKLSPLCLHIAAPDHQGRPLSVEAEPSHGQGWFEVQDEASQIAGLLSGAMPDEKILDLCAGSGGKTLGLAAQMDNQGQIYAYDRDKHRLRPIFERLTRAGVSNVEVIAAHDNERLTALKGELDCVIVDAPCSGSGAWRRRPDAKWRLSQKQLDLRMKEQVQLLDFAAELSKPGGRLVYITCSVFACENDRQISAFLERNKNFSLLPYQQQWQKTNDSALPISACHLQQDTLSLTPANHNTDGFFICIMQMHPSARSQIGITTSMQSIPL